MKRIMVVFGTRPEAIKMCPLIIELKSRINLDIKVCVTGQHKEMLDQVLKTFDIKPDYNLNVMSENQSLFEISTKILMKMQKVLYIVKPDLVLVHGDTTTTFATALSSFYCGIPIGHVEAGLRTFNLESPFPEEFNRQAVSIVSKYNFAPTQLSKENLIKEGKKESTIFVTGNTAIDALKKTIKNDYSNEHLDWASDSKLILVTAHRRENLGDPMINMFKAIQRIIDDNQNIKVIYPIHKNPLVRKIAFDILKNSNRLRIIEPLDVVDFHNFLAKSYIVITDSGGIQEEAPSLGKPVLVMRDETERIEGVLAGTLILTGTSEEKIYKSFQKLLTDKNEYKKVSNRNNPYGDGNASKIIANIIENEVFSK